MNRWIVFFLGLLLGILGCVLLYRFDDKMFKRVSSAKNKEIIITRVDTAYIEAPPLPKKQRTEAVLDTIPASEISEFEDFIDPTPFYYSEFSFENKEEEIFSDQLLATKTVKVVLLFSEKQESKQPDNVYQFFEIQQWSTLVKNKRTYHRNQNMIKIKGMAIDNIKVYYGNNEYFLEVNERYYAIPENENYEIMNLVKIVP